VFFGGSPVRANRLSRAWAKLVWVWQLRRRWWKPTAGAFGWKANPTWAVHLTLFCRRITERNSEVESSGKPSANPSLRVDFYGHSHPWLGPGERGADASRPYAGRTAFNARGPDPNDDALPYPNANSGRVLATRRVTLANVYFDTVPPARGLATLHSAGRRHARVAGFGSAQ